MWKSRWPSWAPRPNKPYGFCGRRKATLNHAYALVTVCPWYVSRHPRTLSSASSSSPSSSSRPPRLSHSSRTLTGTGGVPTVTMLFWRSRRLSLRSLRVGAQGKVNRYPQTLNNIVCSNNHLCRYLTTPPHSTPTSPISRMWGGKLLIGTHRHWIISCAVIIICVCTRPPHPTPPDSHLSHEPYVGSSVASYW